MKKSTKRKLFSFVAVSLVWVFWFMNIANALTINVDKKAEHKPRMHSLYLLGTSKILGWGLVVNDNVFSLLNGIVVGMRWWSSSDSSEASIGWGKDNKIQYGSDNAGIVWWHNNAVSNGENSIIWWWRNNQIFWSNSIIAWGQNNVAQEWGNILWWSNNDAIWNSVVLWWSGNNARWTSLVLWAASDWNDTFAWNAQAYDASRINAEKGILIWTTQSTTWVNLVVNGWIKLSGTENINWRAWEIKVVSWCFYVYDGKYWHVMNKNSADLCDRIWAAFTCDFGNVKLQEWETAIAYNSLSAITCEAKLVTCRNGKLTTSDWNTGYVHPYCYEWVMGTNDCKLWDAMVSNGDSITWYSQKYPDGVVINNCHQYAQTFKCENGVLKNNNYSVEVYKYPSCDFPTSCKLPWNPTETITHWMSVIGYAFAMPTDTGPANSCENNRYVATCQNGGWNPSIFWTNAKSPTCTNQSCTTPWGTLVAHGLGATGYTISTGLVNTPQCENAAKYSLCNNWQWANPEFSTAVYSWCTGILPKDCKQDGKRVTHGNSATFYKTRSVSYGQSCAGQSLTCNDGTLPGSNVYQYSWCTVDGPASCTLNGQTFVHWANVTAYRYETHGSCNSYKATATCNNGVWSNSNVWDTKTYRYLSCTAQPCKFYYGSQYYPHGTTVRGYQFRAPDLPSYYYSCQRYSTTATCNNWTWSKSDFGGRNSTYQYDTCTERACYVAGQTVSHWDSITLYESSSVPYNAVCQSQVRTCMYWQLSGSYQHSSCVVSEPLNCTLDGQTILHWNSITRYESASVPYNATCQSQVRTCTNGLLDGSSSYQYSWCVVNPPVWCTTLWWSGIAHWQGVTWYKKQTPTNMTTNDCDINDNARYYTCSIGQWKYNGSIVNIDGYPHSSYKYSNCWYRTCSLVGQTFDHWVTTTAYKFTTPSSNGSYNICENNQATATCQNGTWSNYNVGVNQTYKYPTCTNRTCSFVGQEFPSSVTITAYRYQNPPYQWANYSCSNSNNYTSVTCQNGNWSSSTFQYTYPYLTCTGRTCALNGQTFQDWDTVIAYKFTTPSSNGSNYACENNQRTAICQNGNWSDSTVGDGKTYRYITCTNRTCKLPESSEMVEHWTVATRYRYANSTSYRPCNQYMQTATCQNGTRNPSFSSTYKYLTCS